MVSCQPLNHSSFFKNSTSTFTFCTPPRGNSEKEETTHPEQKEFPNRSEDIAKRITKDTWALKGKVIDTPFPANINPSRTHE